MNYHSHGPLSPTSILELLNNPDADPYARRDAAEQVHCMHNPGFLLNALLLMAQSSDYIVREGAAIGLRYCLRSSKGSARALHQLVKMRHDPEPSVHRLVEEAFQELDD